MYDNIFRMLIAFGKNSILIEQFQTLLRLPDSMPKELKMAKMMEIVDALELRKCLNIREC